MEPKVSLPNSQEPATCLCSKLDQSSPWHPHSTSWRSILILSSHLAWVVSFPQVSPPKPCTQLTFVCATCPVHLIFLVLMTWTVFGEEYRSLSSSFCSFLHSPVTSSLLGPNIVRSTLFSTTHSHSSLNWTHTLYGFHFIRTVQLWAKSYR